MLLKQFHSLRMMLLVKANLAYSDAFPIPPYSFCHFLPTNELNMETTFRILLASN